MHQSQIETLEPRTLLAAGGRVDPFFGIRHSIIANRDSTVLALGQQPDGRVLAVVNAYDAIPDGTGDFSDSHLPYLLRLLPTGEPDTTFGPGGIRSANLDGTFTSAAIDAQGRPLFLGTFFGQGRTSLVRLTTDGRRDASFGINGVFTFGDYSTDGAFAGHDIHPARDGSIMFGVSNSADEADLQMLRITPGGTLDTTFGGGGGASGGDGIARFDFPPTPGKFDRGGVSVEAVAPDGSIYGLASHVVDPGTDSSDPITSSLLIVKFDRDGKLLASRTIDPDSFNDSFSTFRVLLGGDGRIILVREPSGTSSGDVTTIEVSRFRPDLSPDVTFAGDGTRELLFPGATDIKDSLVQSDGKVVIAYDRPNESTAGKKLNSVMRLRADGQTDPDFGDAGTIDVPIGGQRFDPHVGRLALATDGTILLAGKSQLSDDGPPNYNDPFLTRLWRDEKPAATMGVRDVKRTSASSLVITITYRSPSEAFFAGNGPFDNRDLRITGPNGFVRYAKFDRIDTISEAPNPDELPTELASQIVVRYKLPAPGGRWDFADNGSYTVRLMANAVDDGNGSAGNDARTLGTLQVRIAGAPAARTMQALAASSERARICFSLDSLSHPAP